MTDQINLSLLWASSGGTTPVSNTKYENGWVAEKPTFQNFNYMLQGLDQNMLHYAEYSSFNWQTDISYVVGAKVVSPLGIMFTARAASLGTSPDTDVANSTWVHGWIIGASASTLLESDGFKVTLPTRTSSLYSGVDLAILNRNPMVELRTLGDTNNWAIGNTDGEVVVHNLGKLGPDSRSLVKDGSNTHRLFHEGHKPTVSEVVGAIPEVPSGGAMYGRTNGNWVRVTSTTISEEPPSASIGNGQGWFNLLDAQLYIDIDDDDSSQWVPASPPLIIDLPEIRIVTAWVNFDGTQTPPTIRASYNVIDITDLGTGLYQVNFSSDMDNINFASTSSSGETQNHALGSFQINIGTDKSLVTAIVLGGID
jgi:hypothetical protein